MFFAISKINFDLDTKTSMDNRDLKILAEKIRVRFKVCAMVCDTPEFEGEASIAIATLGGSEKRVSKQLDSIMAFCEESGFGRVDHETTLLDHISSISDGEEVDS